MSLFPHIPGYEGQLLRIPPCAGMRGRVHWTFHDGEVVPPDGTEVEVLGPGTQNYRVRVRILTSGEEVDLLHMTVDCGHAIFYKGKWVPWTDDLSGSRSQKADGANDGADGVTR